MRLIPVILILLSSTRLWAVPFDETLSKDTTGSFPQITKIKYDWSLEQVANHFPTLRLEKDTVHEDQWWIKGVTIYGRTGNLRITKDSIIRSALWYTPLDTASSRESELLEKLIFDGLTTDFGESVISTLNCGHWELLDGSVSNQPIPSIAKLVIFWFPHESEAVRKIRREQTRRELLEDLMERERSGKESSPILEMLRLYLEEDE